MSLSRRLPLAPLCVPHNPRLAHCLCLLLPLSSATALASLHGLPPSLQRRKEWKKRPAWPSPIYKAELVYWNNMQVGGYIKLFRMGRLKRLVTREDASTMLAIGTRRGRWMAQTSYRKSKELSRVTNVVDAKTSLAHSSGSSYSESSEEERYKYKKAMWRKDRRIRGM
ncbi:hypothetical protein Scep_007472 [Stephania cephalantha]|uniref:Uncharacterized protein n=1 Tax=Stephania cephalantha TaxID=152367 RepID=A0AAP0KB93_9MAGN